MWKVFREVRGNRTDWTNGERNDVEKGTSMIPRRKQPRPETDGQRQCAYDILGGSFKKTIIIGNFPEQGQSMIWFGPLNVTIPRTLITEPFVYDNRYVLRIDLLNGSPSPLPSYFGVDQELNLELKVYGRVDRRQYGIKKKTFFREETIFTNVLKKKNSRFTPKKNRYIQGILLNRGFTTLFFC